MKKLQRSVRVSLAGLLWVFAASWTAGEKIETGELAPNLSATTLRRTTVDLEALRGKIVLLQFWASWCESCIDGMPDLALLYDEHGGDDFEIVGISLDEDPRAARRAIAEFGLSWPQICDALGKESPLARSYGVAGTPRYVLIDRQGLVHAAYVRPSELEAKLRALLESR